MWHSAAQHSIAQQGAAQHDNLGGDIVLRVTKFLRFHQEAQHPVDEFVQRKLRSQPPWIQHVVIERGVCTSDGANALGPERLAPPMLDSI